MLEHTPSPEQVFDEVERVLRPGGWAWVSWTNWYSPWGGHEIVPLHYLGPKRGLAAWRRLYGEPRKNVPFDALWPTYVGRTIKMVQERPGLRLVDALPRYYPSQRWILKVPGLREVLTWNCVLVLEKPER
jgi:SAM-dependent methyltransferase